MSKYLEEEQLIKYYEKIREREMQDEEYIDQTNIFISETEKIQLDTEFILDTILIKLDEILKYIGK